MFEDNFGKASEYPISDLIDIGDLPKYRAHINKNQHNEFKARFFNRITLTSHGTVLKQAINEQGKAIIAKVCVVFVM